MSKQPGKNKINLFIFQLGFHKFEIPVKIKLMKKVWPILILLVTPFILMAYFVVAQTFIQKIHLEVLSNPVKTHREKTVKPEKYEVPVLMYHYIRVADPADALGVGLSVEPQNFDAQMEWLKNHDFETIKLIDLADTNKTALKKIKSENKKPIIITFDDGYTDAYTSAFPVLQEYGFIGTFFVIRNFTGKTEYLTQDQINKMANSGMEIGSHTMDHRNLASLNTEQAKTQIFDSKQDTEIFCYPTGKYNEETINLVKEAGYKVAVTTAHGMASQDSDLLTLPRIRIKNVSLETFAKNFEELK